MLSNLIRSARNVVSGNYLATIGSYYDSRFPPSKFLRSNVGALRVKCILSGFPRTGTHWIRNVIHESTGLATYAVGAKGPLPVSEQGILVKVHARNKAIARAKALWLMPRHQFEGRYIYTYRDPRDAILSLYEMYKHRTGAHELSQQEFLEHYDPIGQYRWEVRAWVLRPHDDVLRLRFEDLKSDPRAEYAKVFRYLGVDGALDARTLERPVAISDNMRRPRRTANAWKTAPDEYQFLIEIVSRQLEPEMRQLGYEVS